MLGTRRTVKCAYSSYVYATIIIIKFYTYDKLTGLICTVNWRHCKRVNKKMHIIVYTRQQHIDLVACKQLGCCCRLRFLHFNFACFLLLILFFMSLSSRELGEQMNLSSRVFFCYYCRSCCITISTLYIVTVLELTVNLQFEIKKNSSIITCISRGHIFLGCLFFCWNHFTNIFFHCCW